MSHDEPLEVFHRVVENRWDASAVAELSGGSAAPTLGFLDTGFPEEIAIAAGYQPMLLTGDLSRTPDLVDDHLDISAPSRIRYLYEALATGRHDACSVLCVTGGDRWIGETAGFFEVYSDVFGAPNIPHVLYLERARGTFAAHREYNRAGMELIAEQLSGIGPRTVTSERLWEAIRQVNHTRALLREVEALRAGDAPQISGVDAHAVGLAALVMPKAAFNASLEGALSNLGDAPSPSASRPRVFLTGSAVDHSGFVRLVEELGAVVVGEDTEFGQRYAHTPVAEDGTDPFEALADRWTYKFPESWAFGRERRIGARVDMAVGAAPDGVIAIHLRGDSAYGWDYPDQAAALQERGIPTLALPDTDYAMRDETRLRASIAVFLGQLRNTTTDSTEEKE
ncbi:2-hydroxyacyl-CoA dehydratase family protein [Citricoccus sp. NPDC055426]|uniref:2-hydroxyacyl-CoA dehydratase subunit D n=1 Tax=Citricoccus sp. NPDC055426 TaxID=3155536 RepID=UPI0034222623